MRVLKIVAVVAAFLALVELLQVVVIGVLLAVGFNVAQVGALVGALVAWLGASLILWWAWRRGLKGWIRS